MNWAEVLFFCYSLRLDSGRLLAEGALAEEKAAVVVHLTKQTGNKTAPPSTCEIWVLRSEADGAVGRMSQTFWTWNYSAVKTLSNINFQLFVRPIHSSTTSHQRVTKGKSPLVRFIGQMVAPLFTCRMRTSRQTPFINLSIECRI